MTTTGRNTTGQRGYIVIPNWDRFQHYKDRQPAWIKLHLKLLGNDAWLELSTPDRCLLFTIWMLVGRYGNGRLKADERWLKGQAKAHKSSLARLNQAGFINFSASALPEPVYSAEKEGSKEPKKEKESARANGAAVNGSYATRQKVLANAIAGARSLVDGEPPHIAEKTIREAYDDDLVPGILAALLKPAPKEPAA